MVISAFFELLHFVEPGFAGLHTVCRSLLLSRFLAPTSHCLAGQCPSFPVCCILCRWAAKKLSVIRPHAVQNTIRLYVRNFHYPTPVRIFPTAFFPSHMGLLCLLYNPNSPPVSGKSVTESGLASTPGTEPGTSRDERMLNSSEFTSSLRVAKLSNCGLCGHNYSQLPDDGIKTALAQISWCRRCICRRRDLFCIQEVLMAVLCTALAPVLPSTHSTWSDWASHLLHLQQGNLFQVVLQLYKNQESGLIFFFFSQKLVYLFICLLF